MGERVAAAWHDYRVLAGAKLRSDWQYRTSFLVLFLASFFATAMDFVGIAVIFTNTRELGGWSLEQVAFLYGVSGMCFGLADFIVGSVERVGPKVRDGSFDQLLIRPVNVLVNLTASEFGFRRLGRILQGLAVFVVALTFVTIDWTLGRVLIIPLMVASGTVIAVATWVITSSVSFWTVNTEELANTFTYGGATITSYPLHIFESWLRVTLTYVFPLVFVNYLPALYVLDVTTPLALPSWLRFASPIAAVIAATVAQQVWRHGLRRYQSTGS